MTYVQLIERMSERVQALQSKHGFDEVDGWSQVEGRPIEVIVDYGEFAALSDLLDEIEA